MARWPVRLEPQPARSLRDRLFELGVEFPCGGLAECGGCRIRVLEGQVPVTAEMRAALSADEIAAGWRLACHAQGAGAITLEVEQWSYEVLSDAAPLPLEPRPGLGAVIDLGTTTVVAQLVDLATGEILAVETALNAQASHGADVMSRIEFERRAPGVLHTLIRAQLETMLRRLPAERPLAEILVAGNTVMHHLCAGLSVEPLAAVPFRSPHLGAVRFPLAGAQATFLPCAGGFVGSDLTAGLLATGLLDGLEASALLDLGTNGEIAVGGRAGIRVASTAAGPAFEAGRIQQGMRAGTGAIDQVQAVNGRYHCRVIGGGPARGLCGSGLVDAVAAALGLGCILPNGRIRSGLPELRLTESVSLTQRDIRELQLAKAAVAAGFELLRDAVPLDQVHLAGAFGNYLRAPSARRIGLLPAGLPEPAAAGNTALRGTRMLLLAPSRREEILERVARTVIHVELAALADFQDAFVENMSFPVG